MKYGIIKKTGGSYSASFRKDSKLRAIPKGTIVEVLSVNENIVEVKPTQKLIDSGFDVIEQGVDVKDITLIK